MAAQTQMLNSILSANCPSSVEGTVVNPPEEPAKIPKLKKTIRKASFVVRMFTLMVTAEC